MLRIVVFEAGARPAVKLEVKISDIITCSSKELFTGVGEDVRHLHLL